MTTYKVDLYPVINLVSAIQMYNKQVKICIEVDRINGNVKDIF
jgi:hypothetical protein